MRPSRGLMGLPSPPLGYDGVVQVGSMQRVQVADGEMRYGGKRFTVDYNGRVTDEQQKPVAVVQDGKLIPIPPQQDQSQQEQDMLQHFRSLPESDRSSYQKAMKDRAAGAAESERDRQWREEQYQKSMEGLRALGTVLTTGKPPVMR